MAAAAREIALCFGVPPLVLGLPGDNTHANYQEANRAFWRGAVIPMIARLQRAFEHWLRPAWPDLRIDYDLDRIDALAQERAAEWARVGAANFLTDDEKREALGYGAKNTAKCRPLLERRFSPDQPRDDQGRWTGGGAEDTAESLLLVAAEAFGELVANYMAGGQRICVYEFDFGLVNTIGSNNLGCLGTLHWSGARHGQMLNDN